MTKYIKNFTILKNYKKPHAVSIIANKVLSFPSAEYLISLDDGEKEISKKVSKAYVEYLKDLKKKKNS